MRPFFINRLFIVLLGVALAAVAIGDVTQARYSAAVFEGLGALWIGALALSKGGRRGHWKHGCGPAQAKAE